MSCFMYKEWNHVFKDKYIIICYICYICTYISYICAKSPEIKKNVRSAKIYNVKPLGVYRRTILMNYASWGKNVLEQVIWTHVLKKKRGHRVHKSKAHASFCSPAFPTTSCSAWSTVDMQWIAPECMNSQTLREGKTRLCRRASMLC